MNTRILFVDDEINILQSVKRLFMEENLSVLTAESGQAALEIMNNDPVAVIVSDNRMPRMSGIEFLERSRQLAPDSIRIMMTGHADLQAAIHAINRSGVSHFITKPWDDRELKETVVGAVERFNMVEAMKSSDEATLLSIAQTIELKDPYTRGHCDRVAQYAIRTAARLGLSEGDTKHARQGCWLHDCGKIGVPEAILGFNGPLSPEQMDVVKNHPRWGAEVARIANLPEAVIAIILHHHERFDGAGYPVGLKGKDIPYLARLVAIADFYDALVSDRPYRKAMPREQAIELLDRARETFFDPEILDVFISTLREN